MAEPVIIDLSRLQKYEAGALLLTHLAYPEKNITHKERGDIHASLCAQALHQLYSDGSECITPQMMKPIYALRRQSQIDKDLKQLPRRLRHRGVAGRMGAFFLKEAALSPEQDIGLPEDMKRISLNEVSAMVMEDAGYSDPENVESRIWRPSLPVIHLAVAVQVMLQRLHKADLPGFNYMYLLVEPFFVEHIVTEAQSYEQLLAQSRLSIAPDTLTRFRIVH